MFEAMKSKISGKGIKLVFPEGNDERILKACELLNKEGLVIPIILGNVDEVNKLANSTDADISGIEIIDPTDNPHSEEMLKLLVELRKGKNEESELKEWIKKTNYFGTMLVKMNVADGLVGGATYSTGDTVKPSLQIIKTVPGVKKVSSAMIMVKDDSKFIFGDCAINISPTSNDIAETAIGCATIARSVDIDPKVALLSFSSMGSASGEEVEKVINAKKSLDDLNVDFDYDGELQFDAAFVEKVGRKKAPNSSVAGQANVFVFPSLEAGNIGYKLVERLAGYEAIGPLLLGLNAPINDLSRGCSVDDIYKLSIITAVQSL